MGTALALIALVTGIIASVGGTVASVVSNRVNREDNQEFTAQENEVSRDFTAEENDKSREFSAEEAEKSREFEEYMASTAMQRQVADYKAAGINVGAIGGAGASSGATNTAMSAGTSSAPMTGSTNGLMNLNQSNGLESMLGRMIQTSAKQTLKQNARDFGNNLENNARRAVIADLNYKDRWKDEHFDQIYNEYQEAQANGYTQGFMSFRDNYKVP